MNKYLNIIIISFFSVLTFSLKNIGFVFFIPIVCFLTFNNYKNILLITPASLLAMLWFSPENIIDLLIVLGIITTYMLIYKNKNYVVNLLFIFLLSYGFLVFFLKHTPDMILNLLFGMVSVAIYGYFCYNMEGALVNLNRTRNFTYDELIMATISVIGATTIKVSEINICVFVAMYFSMYFSKNQYPVHSVCFSLISMFFLRFVYNYEESLLIPFVSAFYMFPSIYAPISLICFCLLGILSEIEIFPVFTLYTTIGLSIVFEIIKGLIISRNDSEKIIRSVYQQAMENVNHEIISFASFLDLFAKKFSTSKEYSQRLSEGINSLTRNYCENCYVRSECFSKNKGKLHSYLKNMILYSKRTDYTHNDNELLTFARNCPYIVEIRKSSILINEKLNLSNISTKSNALIAQLNGVSNVLRQFGVDNTLKTEMDYETFKNIHKGLNDYGFNVCLFEAKKLNINDFIIEVGVKGETFNNIKMIIEEICNNYIPNHVTCLFKTAAKGKTYVNIIPKINYEVEYGYGSIAQEGNNVCGDNYIIKQLNNSKLIAAISDGMGQGYLANQESGTTLKLVDEITNTSVTTETGLQILNTFYFIQDYLEKYSTLDFLEIDRTKGEVTFYKMGAASSYLFHKDESFIKIINEGLPFGIEEIIEVQKFPLQDEDLIIMASDGIFENIVDEQDLENFIKGIKHLAPQKITYEILNYVRNHKTKTSDDMSVISLKVVSVG